MSVSKPLIIAGLTLVAAASLWLAEMFVLAQSGVTDGTPVRIALTLLLGGVLSAVVGFFLKDVRGIDGQ